MFPRHVPIVERRAKLRGRPMFPRHVPIVERRAKLRGRPMLPSCLYSKGRARECPTLNAHALIQSGAATECRPYKESRDAIAINLL
jgi:hypothetical protein